jgi:hypothetical protein
MSPFFAQTICLLGAELSMSGVLHRIPNKFTYYIHLVLSVYMKMLIL